MKDEQPDDDRLRRYLLGELPEAEEDEVESLLLEGDELYERCEALEGDLLDAYEAGHLTAAQGKRIEGWLDSSTDIRFRHEMIHRLRETRPPGIVVQMPPQKRPSRLSWASLAAALLLLAAGFFWFAGRDRGRPPAQNAQDAPARIYDAPAATPTPKSPLSPEPRQAQSEPAPQKPTTAAPVPSHPERLGALLATTLLEIPLEVRRDAADELPKYELGRDAKTRTVRFLFDLPPTTERFGLRLLDTDGREIRSWNELKVQTIKDERALVINLPAEELPPGRYGVEVEPLNPGPDDLPMEIGFEITRGNV
jgi:hypothetical protein